MDGTAGSSATVELLEDQYKTPPYTSLVCRTTADVQGYYRFSVEDRIHYFVKGSRRGAATQMTELLDGLALRSQAARQSGTRRLTRDFRLVPAATVAGRIETESGRPAGNVILKAFYEAGRLPHGGTLHDCIETSSSADDFFSFDGLPPGCVTLAVDDNRYVTPFTAAVMAPSSDIVIKLSDAGGTVDGRVEQLETSAAVDGATVTLTVSNRTGSELPRTSVSGPGGAFRFEHVAAGSYSLSAEKQGLYETMRSSLKLADRESTSGVIVRLYAGHTVTGTVAESETSRPIEGASILIGSGDYPYSNVHPEYTGTTGPDGTYCITGVSTMKSSLSLMAEKRGYVRVYRDSVDDRGGRALRTTTHSVCNIWMKKAPTISGRVVTPQDAPVAGASIAFMNPDNRDDEGRSFPTYSDANGAFEIDAIPHSEVRVKARCAGFPVALSDVINVQDKSISDVKVVLRKGGRVTGAVMDPSGRPIAGADVFATCDVALNRFNLQCNGRSTQSGGNGEFELDCLAPQENQLSATKPGFARGVAVKVCVNPDETQSSVALWLKPAHFLCGKVTDGAGEPVAQATVSAMVVEGSGAVYANSDAFGGFRFDGLGEDTYDLSAQKRGHVPSTKIRSETDRSDVRLVLKHEDLANSKTATLVGKVIDRTTRKPVRDFTVYSPAKPERDPASAGVFVARGLVADQEYRFRIKAAGYCELEVEHVKVAAGQDKMEMTFELGTPGSLRGRVIARDDGRPIAGARVRLKGRESERETADYRPAISEVVTGADGRFRLDAVEKGGNYVSFGLPNAERDLTLPFEVDYDKETDTGDIVLGTLCTIRGRVVDAGGTPQSGALVTLSLYPGTWREYRTDSDGRFEFSGLTNCMYTLAVPVYRASRSVDVSSRDQLDVLLRAGNGVLRGTAMRGTAAIESKVILSRDGWSVSASTSPQGKFEFKDLAPGIWHYDIHPHTKGPPLSGEEVITDGATEKTYVLSPAAPETH